jgi:hypothetical protein
LLIGDCWFLIEAAGGRALAMVNIVNFKSEVIDVFKVQNAKVTRLKRSSNRLRILQP